MVVAASLFEIHVPAGIRRGGHQTGLIVMTKKKIEAAKGDDVINEAIGQTGQTKVEADAPMPSEVDPDLDDLPISPMPKPESQRTKMEETLEIQHLLMNHMSIRQVVAKGYSKSAAEKVSRWMHRKGIQVQRGAAPQYAGRARQEYDELPYQHEIERSEPSPWIVQQARDMLFLDQMEEMRERRAKLKQPPQNNGEKSFQENLILAMVASGKEKSEIKETLGMLREFGFAPGGGNFFQQYAQVKQIEGDAIQQHQRMTSEAYQRAKTEADGSLTKIALEKLSPTIENIGKTILNATTRRAEVPQPSAIPNPPDFLIPSSQFVEKTSLEELRLPAETTHEITQPQPHYEIPESQRLPPEALGYSNLEKEQMELRGGVKKK